MTVATAGSAIVTITVTSAGGGEVELTLPDSGSLMEAMRDAGLPILADCGGACACATCHVYVDPVSLARLPTMSADESALLDLAEGVTAQSRLSCQIPVERAVEGMRIELAPGAQY